MSDGRALAGIYKPEPFIEFPLWGLRRALDDHSARCPKCGGQTNAACTDEWYAAMLRDKIARSSR